MTRTKWKDVLEHAKFFAKHDYLEGIEPGSWEKKNAIEDSLKMNDIWSKLMGYKGTDEEHDIMEFFIEEYNKELERLWNEYDKETDKSTDLCPDCNVYCTKRFIDGRCE